jgi:diguanylate cyclase
VSVNEDYERTLSYARQAMSLMEKNLTPATPQNFELWYNYALGQDKNLINAINEAISNSEYLDPDDACQIYNAHINDNLIGEKVDELSSQMGLEAEQLTAMIQASVGVTSSYGDSMEDISGKLENIKNPKQLKALMGTILTATRDMESTTRELEEKLEESKRKIEELNSNLDEVRSESRTDALTGIDNRKSFDEQIILKTNQAKETGQELCLLLGDIDFFKKFNDTYGHQTGDQVLRLVAHSIKSNVKGRDVAARYGGEEFTVILPQTNLRDAVKLGNYIRETIQAKELVKRSTGESLGTVTMSFGAARYIPGEPPSELIKRADACLYAAKHAGRNRVKAETDTDIDMSMVA